MSAEGARGSGGRRGHLARNSPSVAEALSLASDAAGLPVDTVIEDFVYRTK